MKLFLSGLVIGALVAALLMAVVAQHRASWLSRYQFSLTQPPVPDSILRRIREAEAGYYAELPWWRQIFEHAQDSVAVLAPSVIYRLNLSVGRYRIKAGTIDELLAWAMDEGYLTLAPGTQAESHDAIAYFAVQPVLNDWEAALYVAWLKDTHPALSEMTWASIESDPRLVAKLYSGYVGAGGDMDGWRATTEPGPVALRRMNLEP